VRIFRFIAARKAEHSIKLMCRVLEVSRSGFHAWAAREPSPRAVADARLTARIAEIHERSRKTYGSPRATPSCASRTASVSVASASSG
jgi:putative transposase